MIIFSWLEQPGVQGVISLIYKVIDIIRIIVPIALILMTTIDIFRKIIDPNDKEGQQRIMRRALAALLIFLLPTILRIVFKAMDIDVVDLREVKSNTINNQGNNNNQSNNTNNYVIYSINITNCPNLQNVLKPGETYTINTDIPSNYNGEIKWTPREDHNAITVISGKNSRSATIKVLDNPDHCFTDITVSSGNVKSNCVIVIDSCKN